MARNRFPGAVCLSLDPADDGSRQIFLHHKATFLSGNTNVKKGPFYDSECLGHITSLLCHSHICMATFLWKKSKMLFSRLWIFPMNDYQRFLKMNVTSSSCSIMSSWQFSSPQYHIICQPALFVFSIGGNIQRNAPSINEYWTFLRIWRAREKSRKYLESLQGSSISLGEQQST